MSDTFVFQTAREREAFRLGIQNLSDCVAHFRECFGLPMSPRPALLSPADSSLHLRLLREELRETEQAIEENNLPEIADGIADVIYICVGMALHYGIPIMDVLIDVHNSNMSKLGADGKPLYREDGKVLKGPNYYPPDPAYILRLAGWEG